MKRALAPLGITQGVAHAALVGPEELARARGGDGLIRLGSNESPYGPSPAALEALARENVSDHRYGDPSCASLRAAIARRHGVAPENVAVGAGIDDLLGWIVRAYGAPGSSAVAGLGTFPTFEMHATGYGLALARVPYLVEGRLDLPAMLEATRRTHGALVFVPNPDNPTGSWYAWPEIATFLDALPDDSLLIHDEAYANFVDAPGRVPEDLLDPRVIRLRTFSKEYGLAGARVGYALGDATAVAALDAVRLLYGVSRGAQAAALAALGDEAFVRDVVRRIAAGRRFYERVGAELGFATLPSTTNFVLFDFGSRARAERGVAYFLECGIHVRKPPHPPLDRYVRISVGTNDERLIVRDTLRAFSTS